MGRTGGNLGRRSLLVGGLAVAALTACGTNGRGAAAADPADSPKRVLLAYFSRAGENYYYGGRTTLTVGNTEVLAGLVRERIACDVHRIEAAQPYSDDYDDTVARNVAEQRADARPPIAGPLPDPTGYDVVLLGSGLWNVRPPMIMRTFAESLDLRGKVVLPVVTYAVSGIGAAPAEYAAACPGATVGEGLAVRGEEVAAAGPQVSAWLRQVGLNAT